MCHLILTDISAINIDANLSIDYDKTMRLEMIMYFTELFNTW